MKIEKFVIGFLLFILVGIGVVVSFNNYAKPSCIIQTDTIIEMRVDTIRDTVIVEKPVPKYCYIQGKIDTLVVHNTDTLLLELPLEHKVYQDSLYYAEISGFKPNLDTLAVFPVTYTKTITKTIVEPRRGLISSVGVFGGYSPFTNRFDVIIGGGISISF